MIGFNVDNVVSDEIQFFKIQFFGARSSFQTEETFQHHICHVCLAWSVAMQCVSTSKTKARWSIAGGCSTAHSSIELPERKHIAISFLDIFYRTRNIPWHRSPTSFTAKVEKASRASTLALLHDAIHTSKQTHPQSFFEGFHFVSVVDRGGSVVHGHCWRDHGSVKLAVRYQKNIFSASWFGIWFSK